MPPMDAAQAQSMDEILASIRKLVANGAPPTEPRDGEPDDEPPEGAPAVPAAERIFVAEPDAGEPARTDAAPTLEAVVRSMLEPQLKAWLDANLPELVERVALAEIRRLTGR